MFYFSKIIIPSILLLPAYGTDVPGTINSSKWFFFIPMWKTQKLGVTFLRRLQTSSPHLWLLPSLIVAGIFWQFLAFCWSWSTQVNRKITLASPSICPIYFDPIRSSGPKVPADTTPFTVSGLCSDSICSNNQLQGTPLLWDSVFCLLLETVLEAQNGVTSAKLHVTKPRLITVLSPRNGILNQSGII